uniref:Embryo-specific protein ATS3A-like isoform X2 n=1 Tax=Cicer arietinum TaxID=3827 RepID=A0A1S3E7A6_CICAR|nr:embryo-specific protein ATS3A-like isoform X2 [Cicer arietinum]
MQKRKENVAERNCNYMVTIKTSCHSPRRTNDKITVLFGDFKHFVPIRTPKMNSNSKRFERCTTTKFKLLGSCLNKLCRLYVIRSGSDGWMPEYVTVDDYKNTPISIYFSTFFPDDGAGYGLNFCYED